MASSSRASAYVAALKIPLTVLCIFGTVLAGYYFFYVTLHQSYLIERDFRLLATLGDQIESSIQSQERIFHNLYAGDVWASPGMNAPSAGYFVPSLRGAVVTVNPDATQTFVLRLREPQSRFLWMRREDLPAEGRETGVVRLELKDILDPLLNNGPGIFDALLIAAPDGRVVYHAGDVKLGIAHLDRLTQRTDPKAPELTFQALGRSPTMTDVVVAGSPYKLFTQPCCVQMVRFATPGKSPGDAVEKSAGDGWVLCGLVAQRKLSARSYAVSFSTLILLSALLLVGLLSWPFLKLILLGESQRVRAHDVVLVAICAMLGLSLLTMGGLDYLAYGRELHSMMDQHLKDLAIDIDQQAHEEVQEASAQLDALQETYIKEGDSRFANGEPDQNLTHSAAFFTNNRLGKYPFFESFALIDHTGMQQRKLTLGSVGTLLISARDREYFTHWDSTPPVPEEAAGSTVPWTERYYIEAIRSNTTGAREAVISTRTKSGPYPVAAISTPLRALIDPVVVPGFGFAVIDEDGKVLFHSDAQHSLSENFFVESDNNRRLRSLVQARHVEWVDIQYWGDDHRALVYPMHVGQRWTLVTFYDQELVRTVNVEWLVLALVLLILYVGAYVAVCLGVLFMRPRYRAPWLWPDPTKSREYVDLVPALVLLAGAFVLAIVILPPTQAVEAAWLLPCLTWVIIYQSLAHSGSGARPVWPLAIGAMTLLLLVLLARGAPGWLSWAALMAALIATPCWVALLRSRRATGRLSPLALPVNVSFGLMAGLGVVITAVLPATAFFRAGHAIQLESFVKYGQLRVAQARIEDEQRDTEADAKDLEALGNEDWSGVAVRTLAPLRSNFREGHRATPWGAGVYQAFFFSTTEADTSRCQTVDSSQGNVLPELVEEALPFYSESSVALREMVHDAADDGRWSWRHHGTDLTYCPQGSEIAPFQSTVPRIFAVGADEARVELVISVFLLLLVGGAVAWVVRFTLHQVFVIDVIEPLWSGANGALDASPGQNLFLITEKPGVDPPQLADSCIVDMAGVPEEAADQARWFDEQLGRAGQSPVGQQILLLHFEHGVHDAILSTHKLAFIERLTSTLHRTIVLVSSAPPAVFTAMHSATAPATPPRREDDDWIPRWVRVLSTFTVVPVAAAPGSDSASAPAVALADRVTGGWREIVWRINALGFSHSAGFLEDEPRDTEMKRLWKDVLPYAWHPDRPALTLAQLLVEVGERSESHYHEIWATCTPAEKLALGQIAGEGLVNQKTARTVRLLMARGLVRRQPNFVVMNETFRRFVLSTASRAEVTALEDQATGTWDSIRWPFMVLLFGSLAFFFATQHELFNAALGILTGLAATLPALMKITSLFGGGHKEA